MDYLPKAPAILGSSVKSEHEYYYADGSHHLPLHSFELTKEPWTQVYRSTGTPCSCPLCRGNKYDRLAYKRDTRHIIQESMD